MWRILYRLLAWMSGGPTIEVADDWETRYFQMLDNYWTSSTREARLSEQLGDAHAKITELESECEAFCDAINGLLAAKAKNLELIDEARTVIEQTRLTMEDRLRQMEKKDDLIARWKTAHDTVRDQRDAALAELAAIQQQTAKYVGH
jgi:chromosome segregation ATPase